MFTLKKLPVSTLSYVMRISTQFSSVQGEAYKSPLPKPPQPPQNEPVDISKLRIYKNSSTLDLFNMLLMNTVCTKDIFVDNCHHIYRLSSKIAGSRITEAVINSTMGRIFTAGDSLKTVENFINRWPNKNIDIIIDYSNEAVPGQVITKESLDANCHVFCETVGLANKAGGLSGAAIKPSALCLHEVLMRANKAEERLRSVFSSGFASLNETLTARELMAELVDLKMDVTFSDLQEFFALFLNKELKTENDLDVVNVTKFEWLNKVHVYDIQSAQKNANKIITQFAQFTDKDMSELSDFNNRMHAIFKRAYEEKSYVLVDAEQTYIQTTIDFFTNQYSEIYNKESAIVINTFQNYLKATKDRVIYELERCKALNILPGIKLVRGAYMVEERRLAKEHGYADPIHNTIQETHQCYNDNVRHVLKNWIPKSHLIVASHNEQSVTLGGSWVKEFNITPDKGYVQFVQLMGLGDHLTYTTAAQGLNTAKYIPFGPTNIMIPYLIRRAQESKQMLQSANLQRTFVFNELGSRLRRTSVSE